MAESLSEEQNLARHTIRSLASDGLFDIGDLTAEGGRFRAWDMPLDESMQQIHAAYRSQRRQAGVGVFVLAKPYRQTQEDRAAPSAPSN